MSSVVHPAAIKAVAKRQIAGLLGNPLGYVFILGFVAATAASVFLLGGDAFLARNIADLQPLHEAMPWLLVVLLPALAMGSWAQERELGTEELLLTMPLSTLDAILGKWLAIVGYFTLALLCTLSNVIVLAWLGHPDAGLIAANYLGWWLAGSVAAAFAVLASVLVPLSSVAFVVGVLLCALVMGHAQVFRFAEWAVSTLSFGAVPMGATSGFGWFDAFNRGLVPFGHVVGALAAAAAALGAAVAVIASRRWRPSDRGTVVGQLLALVFGVILAINVGGIAHRLGLGADITSERLASLSDHSRNLVKDLPAPVTVHLYVTDDEILPSELKPRAQEILDKASALARSSGGRVTVLAQRPKDALDPVAAAAEREFKISTRKVPSKTVTGRELVDVYLGAAVTSVGKSETIAHFDPGLSVEYELVRAIRAVVAPKPVLGIAATDLTLLEDFDMASGRMSLEWSIVKEWRKQYEVRRVDLKSPVADEVKALVVPQPSTLTQDEIGNLHAYVWKGGPTLILEDPLPLFQGMGARRYDLLPGQPKRNPAQSPYGGPTEGGPAKGDLQPLMRALGLDWAPNRVVWTDYNPSDYFRKILPPHFAWIARSQGSFPTDHPAVDGVQSLMFANPGQLRPLVEKPAGIELVPLVRLAGRSAWGFDATGDLLQSGWNNQPQGINPSKRRVSGDPADPAVVAMAVRGTMAAAYPVDVPAATASGATAAAPAERRIGLPSLKPVNVIVVADVDWIADELFELYRNEGNRIDRDEFKFLLDLANVPFTGNVVDALMGDTAFNAIRTRRPVSRPLTRIEAVISQTSKAVLDAEQVANVAFEAEIAKVEADLNKGVDDIRQRDDLEPSAKEHQLKELLEANSNRLERKRSELRIKADRDVRAATIQQRRDVDAYQTWIKVMAISIPAFVLAVIAVAVWAVRRRSERTSIPANRSL
ncbi:MAG: hypothetical protein RLZZ127_312 [Planctomycetota bacterium]|jgi:ABC-2 type transport system permease protein